MPDSHPLFDAPLGSLAIAVFDLETTGLHPNSDAIIQMAVVKVDEASKGDEWMELVNPGSDHRPISDWLSDFTGIKDEDLDGGLSLADAMAGFNSFVENRVVAGHNIKNFDLGFIKKAESNTGIDVQSYYFIDTLKLMRALHPELSSHTLASCAEFYDIDFDSDALHDALVDTRLTADVMLMQIDELKAINVITFMDMIQYWS